MRPRRPARVARIEHRDIGDVFTRLWLRSSRATSRARVAIATTWFDVRYAAAVPQYTDRIGQCTDDYHGKRQGRMVAMRRHPQRPLMPSRHRPAPEPLVDRPGHLIRRLQQIAHAIFIEQAREFDVTPVQYAALFAINDHPGIDQTALCNIIAYDRSTIGDVVGRL